MRLIQIKNKTNIAYEKFKPEFTTESNYYVKNVICTKIALEELLKIGIIKESDSDFIPLILSANTDSIILTNSLYNKSKNWCDNIHFLLDKFHAWINEYVPTEENDTTINVKLPNITNLDQLAEVSTLLRKSLNQIVAESGGTVSVKQLDHGSYWVILDVGIVEAAAIVCGLVKCALHITKESIGMLSAWEKLKNLRLDNDLKSLDLEVAKNKFIKGEIHNHAIKIDKDYFIDNGSKEDHERLRRIEQAIDQLTILVEKGCRIYPALNPSKNIEDMHKKYKELENYSQREFLTQGKTESQTTI